MTNAEQTARNARRDILSRRTRLAAIRAIHRAWDLGLLLRCEVVALLAAAEQLPW